jgi:hypothetical protein
VRGAGTGPEPALAKPIDQWTLEDCAKAQTEERVALAKLYLNFRIEVPRRDIPAPAPAPAPSSAHDDVAGGDRLAAMSLDAAGDSGGDPPATVVLFDVRPTDPDWAFDNLDVIALKVRACCVAGARGGCV